MSTIAVARISNEAAGGAGWLGGIVVAGGGVEEAWAGPSGSEFV